MSRLFSVHRLNYVNYFVKMSQLFDMLKYITDAVNEFNICNSLDTKCCIENGYYGTKNATRKLEECQQFQLEYMTSAVYEYRKRP